MNPRTTAGFAFVVILHLSLGSASAQDDGYWYFLGDAQLGVGDPTPKLAVREFVRGEAVAEFERGKVYVIEFWKCRCPPCRAAIPHLNDLQKKYPSVIFISVGVISPTLDNKDYVKNSGDRMAYRVAVDQVPPGKDPYANGAMVQGWLMPAGQDAVPTSFIVDPNGRIAWIGSPMDLDAANAGKPIENVVAGTWDVKSAAAKFASRPQNDEAGRKRIDQLPATERDAIKAIQKRARRVMVGIQGDTVTDVRFDPSRVTDSVIADVVDELQKLKGLQSLDLCGTEITDAGLKKLRGLTTLQSLDLGCTHLTDAGLKELREWKDLRTLDLHGSRVTGAGLQELKSMTKLQLLDLSGVQFTAAGLKDLKDLLGLHVLNVSRTRITDSMLKELHGMESLHGLNLCDTNIADAGLKELKGLKLGVLRLKNTHVEGSGLKQLSELVEALDLSGTRVADAGLSEMKRFAKLRNLNLNGTQVTDAGLSMLRGNRGLQGLNLADTRLTDAGLKNLHDMKDLRSLDLNGTGVTNAGLNELKHLKELIFLDVARTKVTKAGVVGLRAALPNLEVPY